MSSRSFKGCYLPRYYYVLIYFIHQDIDFTWIMAAVAIRIEYAQLGSQIEEQKA